MQIKVTEPIPVDQYIEPAMEFPITLSYNNFEIPIGIHGLLLAEDNKILASLKELVKVGAHADEIGSLGAFGTNQINGQIGEVDHSFSLVSILNNKAIDHIGNLRDKNPKGDVNFKLILKIKVCKSTALIAPLHRKDPAEIGPPMRAVLEQMGGYSLIAYKHAGDYTPKENDLWLISGQGGPQFLSLSNIQQEITKTIYSSNWIQDFAPKFGVGKYIVAELPLPPSKAITGEFSKRLNEAAESLQKIQNKIQEGEWTEAVEKCRPVVELMRDEEMIKSILGKHGYNEDAANSLYSAIKGLFEFSSKFHHKVDKDKKTLLPVAQAEKEDAYFAYSTSIALVNLIAQKISKPELA